MAQFEPRDANFSDRVRKSFAEQPFIQLLGGELILVEPGAIDIKLPFQASHAQQYGYVHGGAVTTIADAAAAYSAMTLATAGVGVLTTELKVNFLRPAGDGDLVAKGRVIKPGRSLSICQADVYEMTGSEVTEKRVRHVLTGLVTMMSVEGRDN